MALINFRNFFFAEYREYEEYKVLDAIYAIIVDTATRSSLYEAER